MSSDPADLFGQLYDQLPARLFAEEEEAEGWLASVAVRDIAAEVEHHAVLYGHVSAGGACGNGSATARSRSGARAGTRSPCARGRGCDLPS